MSHLHERTAFVTGGARGIGASTANVLHGAGMNVVIGDVLDGTQVADSLGSSARFEPLDVTDADSWRKALAQAENAFGPIDVLINNAGIVDFGGIESVTPARFRRVLDVNLMGTFLGIYCAADQLSRSGQGVVVNVSSTAGLLGYQGLASYVASKWGIRGLTKAAALDLSAKGIRVCSVHPGPIRTPMTEGIDDEVAANQPIARFGHPEEVAAMIRFIVTEATYCTGSEFIVDGGATTGIGLVETVADT
ncbi:SDR family oxidoreductase [Gordonia sp. SID5947]|uniref:SDR family NAD(P)-dependent oxidoreductase n=1 Tax=Gordonia sp. SID5947 TaxID=2690315 RepID=UPI00137082DE|nr:SDR family oxidoreductase [Gordonia sp. SID5947]MYR05491.1 SDR family oxidoreductase [Gordonia sp. SID5947]